MPTQDDSVGTALDKPSVTNTNVSNQNKAKKDVIKRKEDIILINPDIKDVVQEATERHAVMAFGRMNPPTTGHAALVDTMHKVAKEHNASHVLIASHSHDPKKNPLSGEDKLKHLKRFFPKTNVELSNKEHPTFLQQAARLHKSGVTHLHMVAGSDRVDEYKQKLAQYNGEGEGKLYNFKSITVHSSGERDPDAEGTVGMSASKMREHAGKGDFESFKKGIPSHVSDEHAKELYHDTRKGMGLHEELDLSERVVSIQQRRQRAVQMKRLSGRLHRAAHLARTRLATEKQLERRAAKTAKQNVRRRFAGQRGAEYQTLSPSDKVRIDTNIDPKVKNLKAMVKRLMPRIRQSDVKRLQAARSHKKYTKGAFPVFNSVELDVSKFNQLYEQFFKEEITKADINALFRKAMESGINTETINEVFAREFVNTNKQKAFDRVNSFIARGKTFYNDDADLAETVTKAGKPVKGKEDNKITHIELPTEKMVKNGLDHHTKDNYGRTSTFKHKGEHVNVYQRGYIESKGKHVVSVRGVNGASDEAIKKVISKLREGVIHEDAASHVRMATKLSAQGKNQAASIHRRIASALNSGDKTTAQSLKQELLKVKE